MKTKIGAITIGQSPRVDVVPEMETILGPGIAVLQAGALDGLTHGQINELRPGPDDLVLVSRLTDGSSVKLGESRILPRIQSCVTKLEAEGAELIVLICTGKFPVRFQSNRPLIYPQPILHAVAPKLAFNGKIGVINPDRDQLKQCREIWGQSVATVEAVAGSPYGALAEISAAAHSLKGKPLDLIVMDCIGYTVAMKDLVREITGKPVILARTLIARIISEMMG
jgi:protein AroM